MSDLWIAEDNLENACGGLFAYCEPTPSVMTTDPLERADESLKWTLLPPSLIVGWDTSDLLGLGLGYASVFWDLYSVAWSSLNFVTNGSLLKIPYSSSSLK